MISRVLNSQSGKSSTSKRIAERLREDFFDAGTLEPGDRMPSVRELVERYGYSRMSLVQALAMLEDDGLIDRRHGVGSFVVERAQPASNTPLGFVGLIAFNARPGNNVALGIHSGVDEACRKQGLHVVLSSVETVAEEEAEFERLIAAGCRSLVIYPVARTEGELRTDYLNSKHLDVPVVLVDMAYPEQHRTQVVFDNYQAGLDVAELLIGRGHRRIAFMKFDGTASRYNYSNHQRYKGYMEAMKNGGLAPLIWDFAPWTPEPVYRERIQSNLQAAAETGKPVTAIVALHDTAAFIAMNVASQMGLRVPEDLVVTGFDNNTAYATFLPRLITTAPGFREAGRLGARLALQLSAGETIAGQIFVLPVPIIERDGSLQVIP
ncbi:MAG: GntR family transcriptional regulator [Capsulimonadaceae bacterium]|nr:GntR family transcriptional regulator [Capsulimonadaceae bacterium]